MEKIVPADIHLCLLNGYGEQTVDVSTVRQWMLCFTSRNSDMRDNIPGGPAQLSAQKIKSALISSSLQICGLQPGNFEQS